MRFKVEDPEPCHPRPQAGDPVSIQVLLDLRLRPRGPVEDDNVINLRLTSNFARILICNEYYKDNYETNA